MGAFDMAVLADPFNEANDAISMNKVFEHGALGVAAAGYPLRESEKIVGAAGVHAPTLDPAGLAEACLALMRDQPPGERCAAEAARFSAKTFVGENEAKKYVEVFERTPASARTTQR